MAVLRATRRSRRVALDRRRKGRRGRRLAPRAPRRSRPLRLRSARRELARRHRSISQRAVEVEPDSRASVVWFSPSAIRCRSSAAAVRGARRRSGRALRRRGRPDRLARPLATAATVDARSLFRTALDREATAVGSSSDSAGDAKDRRRDRQRATERGERARRDHSLLLLSRLLFLYFLQQKGWLDGSHRFLRASFERSADGRTGFHTRVLEPLFFGCLSTPHATAPSRRSHSA